ncbi:MAG: prepilin-type N-terminal cleavage/methylation domain-containing protein [Planctomycetota bacterium]|nr:prepilin-type N-terminal cleavage/methylation domain-containing protein [Planctomycetota bacterium]
MQRRKAFTLIELMVVIAIIAALAAILVPVVAGIIERARFVKCGANLNTLGKSFKMYEYDAKQGGPFPTLNQAGAFATLPQPAEVNYSPPTTATVTNDWTSGSFLILGNWPMQQVWPLIQVGMVSAPAFRCAADSGWKPRQSDFTYGWTSLTDVSYGIQYPFEGYLSGSASVRNQGWPGNKARLDRLVIMADRNPGGSVTSGRPPSNHPDIGTNAVDAGGNVVSYESSSDSKCGMKSNDIYIRDSATLGTAGMAGFPRSNEDTVITPLTSR